MNKWAIGETVYDQYQVKELLGRGGMGAVWLLVDQSTGEKYAAKRALFKDSATQKDFLSELQVWFDIPRHSHIVACRFFKTFNEEVVIFSDYFPGLNLAGCIEHDQIASLDQVLDIAIQTAWGIDALHQNSLIHQDIKPGNIIIAPNRTAKITDFGTAGTYENAFSWFSDEVAGVDDISVHGKTKGYCSPEQYEDCRVTAKTDVWSWGVCVLDMMMGGVSCTEGGHMAQEVLADIYAKVEGSSVFSGSHWNILKILDECLVVDLEQRCGDMGVIAQALLKVYEDKAQKPYQRNKPKVTHRDVNLPFVRMGYSSGQWSAPQQWQERLQAIESELFSFGHTFNHEPSFASRSANAVADLALYKEVYLRFKQLVKNGGGYVAKRALCELLFEMGQIYAELNDAGGEISAFEECGEYARGLLRNEPSRHFGETFIAMSLDQIGLRQRTLGYLEAALSNYNEAIAIWKRLVSTGHQNELIRSLYARTLKHKGIALRNLGRFQEAICLYEEVVEILTKLAEGEPITSSLFMELQAVLRFKGVALRMSGQEAQAKVVYEEAYRLLQKMGKVRSDSEFRTELARLHECRGCVVPVADAIIDLGKAAEIYSEQILGYGSENLRIDYARVLSSLAAAQFENGDVNGAVVVGRVSLAEWQVLVQEKGKKELLTLWYEAWLQNILFLREAGCFPECSDRAMELEQRFVSAGAIGGDEKLSQLYSIGKTQGFW